MSDLFTPPEAELFITAFADVDRRALGRLKKLQRTNEKDAKSVEAVEALYHALPLLLDPTLKTVCMRSLAVAHGHAVDDNSPLPMMLWAGGERDTENGVTLAEGLAALGGGDEIRDTKESTIGDFVGVLHARAVAVAQKGAGWVLEPTTNIDGWRRNASTTAMHALFLDCDGRGTWDMLISTLTAMGYCVVGYQSGGWTPTTPKWRVTLPLAKGFAVDDEAGRVAWKRAYNVSRVVFGAIGELRGEGFDPMTETPAAPWFLCERRSESDPARQVIFYPGRALDIDALIGALPAVRMVAEADSKADHHERAAPRTAVIERLSDARLEEIVAAITAPMAFIKETRRELYLALAGTLCSYCLSGDDVVTIITTVSKRCPGSQDRHDEHVRAAISTVKKWNDGGPVTQIGTLADWTDVARAVFEAAHPSAPFVRMIRRHAAGKSAKTAPTKTPSTATVSKASPVEDGPSFADSDEAINILKSLKRRKILSGDADELIRAALLELLIRQQPLADQRNKITYEAAIPKLIPMIAWALPLRVHDDVIKFLFRKSVERSLDPGNLDDDVKQAVATTAMVDAEMRRIQEMYSSAVAERIAKMEIRESEKRAEELRSLHAFEAAMKGQ